ncbi:MAG: hypothetical protein ACFFEN_15560 [Candidatus Thorarchaeota archaeon]
MIIIKPINKFKTYKFDAAPFFFFIDIFPANYSNEKKPNLVNLVNSIKRNPIMPLPMRVDRVFNGERSVLIRPQEPVSFPITEDITAIINPLPFLQFGFEKLIYFTEVRAREAFLLSTPPNHVIKWWDLTKFLYGSVPTLEEDFSAFLRAYLHTMARAHLLDEDLTKAAIDYTRIIIDLCRKRIDQNSIIIQVKGKQHNVQMFKVKDAKYYKKFKKIEETQYHPELIDIELCDLSEIGFPKLETDRSTFVQDLNTKEIKYIPILFYDDLLECMLQNAKSLKDNDGELLDPSILFDNEIVLTKKADQLEELNIENYSWWDSFENIDLALITDSLRKTQIEFIQTLEIENKERIS